MGGVSVDGLKKHGEQICEYFSDNRRIAVWGCGVIGREIVPVINAYGLLDALIDNDLNKQQEGWGGFKVCAPEEYFNSYTGAFIVIAAIEKNVKDIECWLQKRGLKKYRDYAEAYYFLKEIFPYYSYYGLGKLYTEISQICLTERCTLKCEKCAHACNRVPMDAEDMPWSVIQQSADTFFRNVDYVREFVLIGGEPFLCKNIGKAIKYIGDKYRKQIGMFSITTNGTIAPNEEVMSLCKQYNVTIRLSNYADTLPNLLTNYRKLYDAAEGVETIEWKTNAQDAWYDYGFGDVDNGDDTNTLCSIFQKCRTSCREIRGNRYYYCVMARSVSENSGYNIGLDEYFDMDGVVDRDSLFAYEMGCVPNGYLSMCRYCRGKDAYNHRIPAAIQDNSRG